ncbi:MAG TPA: hypothetical protein VNG51_29680 [Ktedonobacteraceae bacterium]|nr:hypothetical protein [Ktedonobacteraceae bacterium]
MNTFDDMLPEEKSKQYEPLLALLSHAAGKLATLTPEEKAQAIARVQERLLAESTMPQSEDTATQQAEPVQLSSQRTRAVSPRRQRILHYINTFAAILVIGAIIGAALLLFRHQPPTTGGNPPQAVGTPGVLVGSPMVPHLASVTAVSTAGGVEASLTIIGGPYFLSELLQVDITLTNHSHTTFLLQGVPASNPCDQAIWVNYTLTGANTAHYSVPASGGMSCPFMMSQFKPGQTIVIRQYIPLTDSGNILLSEEARFLVTKSTPNQGKSITDGPSPLDGRWPSLHINVASRVPSNRVITLHRVGSKVFVNAPAAVRSRLLYLYSVGCQDLHDPGNTASGNFSWTSTGTTIGVPGCPGKNVRWMYAVSAPGYAITTGSYTS